MARLEACKIYQSSVLSDFLLLQTGSEDDKRVNIGVAIE